MERYRSLYDLARWIGKSMESTEFLGFGKYRLVLDVEDKVNPKFKAYHNVVVRLVLVKDRRDLCVVCSTEGSYNSDDKLECIIDEMASKMLRIVY